MYFKTCKNFWVLMEQKIKKGMKKLGVLIHSDDMIIGLNRYEVVLVVNGCIIIMVADLVPSTSCKVLLPEVPTPWLS